MLTIERIEELEASIAVLVEIPRTLRYVGDKRIDLDRGLYFHPDHARDIERILESSPDLLAAARKWLTSPDAADLIKTCSGLSASTIEQGERIATLEAECEKLKELVREARAYFEVMRSREVVEVIAAWPSDWLQRAEALTGRKE